MRPQLYVTERVLREKRITLEEASELPLVPVSEQAVRYWAVRGLRTGPRLEAYRSGRCLYTSEPAVRRFLAQAGGDLSRNRVAGETLLTLGCVARQLKVTYESVLRWTRGQTYGGITLESVWSAGSRYTSDQALHRFLERTGGRGGRVAT